MSMTLSRGTGMQRYGKISNLQKKLRFFEISR
jgi:hypothetical protein